MQKNIFLLKTPSETFIENVPLHIFLQEVHMLRRKPRKRNAVLQKRYLLQKQNDVSQKNAAVAKATFCTKTVPVQKKPLQRNILLQKCTNILFRGIVSSPRKPILAEKYFIAKNKYFARKNHAVFSKPPCLLSHRVSEQILSF